MEHHEAAIAVAEERFGSDPGIEAVVVVGSVARGEERPDSDLDLVLVVSDEEYDRQLDLDRVSFTEPHGGYGEGSYFDVKYATRAQLASAVDHGDDPMRASFEGARIVWSTDGAIHSRLAELLSSIVDRSDDAWREAEGAFVSQARLHGGYFLRQGELLGDPLLLHHAAVHLSFAVGRAVLARHRVLFAGPKYLDKRLRHAGEAELVDRLRELVESPSLGRGTSVLDDLERRGPWPVTRAASLSRFVADNELAWSTGRIPPEYR